MFSRWKHGGLAFAAGMLGCSLIAILLWRSADRPSTDVHPHPDPAVPPTKADTVPALSERRSNLVTKTSDADPSAPPAPQLEKGADVLRLAEACLRPDLDDSTTYGGGADAAAIWRCLQDFDWLRVTSFDLATWLCAEKRPLQQASRVIGAALYARPPKEALAYLAEYNPTCLQVRESGLQIMAIEAIGLVDRQWVAELGRSMTPDALFTGHPSTQGILLAELFIRDGNGAITTILENGGRGEYGGSDEEISRAAATSLFVSSSSQWDANRSDNAWAYAESLISSPTTPPIVGDVLAAFLPSKQTWPGGDSTPALTTLALAMDDPRFTQGIAAVLFHTQKQDGPQGCNKVLWDEVYAKVLAVAAEKGWEHPSK